MPLKDSLEKAVNIVIALGFLLFALGIGLWAYNLSRGYGFPFEVMLILFGILTLMLGVGAAKIFSKVGG